MKASASGDNVRPHFSQPGLISNGIVTFRFVASDLAEFILRRGLHEQFPVMHKANSIIINAPKSDVFETAANLELWPKILPHYRYIRYLARGPQRNLVVMAAVRSGIPISWTSEQVIDRDRNEIRFLHLKAWTKGMRVVWSFRETPAGVLVEIVHHLKFRNRMLAPLVEPIIGNFFIHHIASKTLRCMKTFLENETAALLPAIQNPQSKIQNV